ncbi:MAG: hypothetical protein JXX29_23390 [Deltaproteobacteria bacterium]|nr:hypothetical protein [Deltaproteobacteria bacterium]MBN2674645.1 hypothetical protein [Deltaproteobacteria bacterium]
MEMQQIEAKAGELRQLIEELRRGASVADVSRRFRQVVESASESTPYQKKSRDVADATGFLSNGNSLHSR